MSTRRFFHLPLQVLALACFLHILRGQLYSTRLKDLGVAGARNFGVAIHANVEDVLASPEWTEEVVRMLYKEGLILFRNQTLTPQQEVAFTKIFPFDTSVQATQHGPQGAIAAEKSTYRKWRINGAEEVQVQGYGTLEDHFGLSGTMSVSSKDTLEWHVDAVYESVTPSPVSCMYSVRTPAYGGETLFASGVSGYDALPDQLRQQAEHAMVYYTRMAKPMRQDGLRALPRHEAEAASHDSSVMGQYKMEGIAVSDRYENAEVSTSHPLVWQHPSTNLSAVCAAPMWTHHVSIEGEHLSIEQSQDFIAEILTHVVSEDTVYPHTWIKGDFVCWDHAVLLHSATKTSSHGPGERINHRTRLQGTWSPRNRWVNSRWEEL